MEDQYGAEVEAKKEVQRQYENSIVEVGQDSTDILNNNNFSKNDISNVISRTKRQNLANHLLKTKSKLVGEQFTFFKYIIRKIECISLN